MLATNPPPNGPATNIHKNCMIDLSPFLNAANNSKDTAMPGLMHPRR